MPDIWPSKLLVPTVGVEGGGAIYEKPIERLKNTREDSLVAGSHPLSAEPDLFHLITNTTQKGRVAEGKCTSQPALCLPAVLWIRIGFMVSMRIPIRIQHFLSKRIEIQGFDVNVNVKNLQLKFFLSKLGIYLSLGLH
jgi:hypothetical protein